jgi:organic radical activating enzyme
VGQIFNSIQGEGIHAGKRQVFVRFAGCDLNCVYCDTRRFRNPRPKVCELELKPGTTKFKRVPNPITEVEVLQHVKELQTPDVHSISLTGGEPLQTGDFLIGVAERCKSAGFRTYLETSGVNRKMMRRVLRYVDIAAIDIKLPEHLAVPKNRWSELFEEELACTRLAAEKGIETFVKIVVLPSTRAETVRRVCEPLASTAEVPLVLQPVTPSGIIREKPTPIQMLRLSEVAAQSGVKEVVIIPQIHKLMGVL